MIELSKLSIPKNYEGLTHLQGKHSQNVKFLIDLKERLSLPDHKTFSSLCFYLKFPPALSVGRFFFYSIQSKQERLVGEEEVFS